MFVLTRNRINVKDFLEHHNHKFLQNQVLGGVLMVKVGVDFGTSNSACVVRLSSGEAHRVVLEPENEGVLLPSWWYYPEEVFRPFVGNSARRHFVQEGYTGRFITSVKTHLRDLNLRSTQINGRSTSIEEIVASLLVVIRERVEERFGKIAVLYAGRPVNLGSNEDHDRKTEDRIRKAYILAGFPDPRFIPESTAAAVAYKETINKSELVFVADFGGGTLDYSLVRLQPARSGKEDKVVGISGAKIGGEDLTAAAMKLFWKDFGQGSELLSATRTSYHPVPLTYYTELSKWTSLFHLQQFRKKIEKSVQWGCTDPAGLERLIALLSDEHYFEFLLAVENLKVALSEQEVVEFVYNRSPIFIRKEVRRNQYEENIGNLITRARRVLEELFVVSGTCIDDVESVFLTGGSSQTPAFKNMIFDIFGVEKIRSEGGIFTSVAEGLAIMDE